MGRQAQATSGCQERLNGLQGQRCKGLQGLKFTGSEPQDLKGLRHNGPDSGPQGLQGLQGLRPKGNPSWSARPMGQRDKGKGQQMVWHGGEPIVGIHCLLENEGKDADGGCQDHESLL